MKPESHEAPEAEPKVRILKTGTCPTLSGKSTLTYHVGGDADSIIQIRVHANSGGGYFNREWIPLSAIQETLKKQPRVTSFALRSLYAGKSTNSPGFLLAVIVAEGLALSAGEKERHYVAADSAKFLAEVKALMDMPDIGSVTPTVAIKKPKKSASKTEVPHLET